MNITATVRAIRDRVMGWLSPHHPEPEPDDPTDGPNLIVTDDGDQLVTDDGDPIVWD